jgi:hypothetical protein
VKLRMPAIGLASVTSAFVLAAVALNGCAGSLGPPGSDSAPMAPQPPPVSMSGRWLLSSPNRGQCHMNFGAASPSVGEGTIAPEGGCPGKFFTSRKWAYEQGSLIIRDHTGRPLAQLSDADGRFDGKASSGELVTLMR